MKTLNQIVDKYILDSKKLKIDLNQVELRLRDINLKKPYSPIISDTFFERNVDSYKLYLKLVYFIKSRIDYLNEVLSKKENRKILYDEEAFFIYTDYFLECPLVTLSDLFFNSNNCLFPFILNEVCLDIYGINFISKLSSIYKKDDDIATKDKLIGGIENFIMNHKEVYIYKLLDSSNTLDILEVNNIKLERCWNPVTYNIKLSVKNKKNSVSISSTEDYTLNKYYISFSKEQLREQLNIIKKDKLHKLYDDIFNLKNKINLVNDKKLKLEEKLEKLEDNLLIEEEKLNQNFNI